MDNIKVLILEVKNKDRELILDSLSNIDYIKLVGDTDDLEEAKYLLEEYLPDVVLLGAELSFDRYIIADYISTELPNTAIIMIDKELKEDTMYKAIFAGAKDVIISPFTSAKLLDSIYRSFQLMKEKNLIHKDIPKTPRRKAGKGNIITVFSTKGGVGKTFLSINLAIALAKVSEKRVCLVDLDLDFGNAALALDVVSRFTILDIVDDIRNIDQYSIESYLVPHDSGIKLLPANSKPQINEFINAEHIGIILRALKGAFDYVVVDMPARFYEPVNPAFQVADALLMITTPEISTIRNIKASIETLEELNFLKAKIKVVLNRSDNSGKIRPKDVESTIEQSLYSVIDADYKLAMLSLNDGNPIVSHKPRSRISKSILALAKKLVSEL